MSMWTYINGTVSVSVPGRSQEECDHILKSIIEHLPVVTGSERDMEIFVNQSNRKNTACCSDEFGYQIYNNEYILTCNAELRDREYYKTLKELSKWLCRLAKRVMVDGILLKLNDWNRHYVIDDSTPYELMYYSENQPVC